MQSAIAVDGTYSVIVSLKGTAPDPTWAVDLSRIEFSLTRVEPVKPE